ncbi:unnamed protein product [Closterium sp. NIES-53]
MQGGGGGGGAGGGRAATKKRGAEARPPRAPEPAAVGATLSEYYLIVLACSGVLYSEYSPSRVCYLYPHFC